MRTLYKSDTSLKRTLLLGTNGARFIEIPLYNVAFPYLKKQERNLGLPDEQKNSLFSGQATANIRNFME